MRVFVFEESVQNISRENRLESKALIIVEPQFLSMKGAKNPALSRMEMYLAIIKVLDNGDAITQQQIMRKAQINSIAPDEFLNFLIKLDLIREKNFGNKKLYFITDKGQRLCMYFGLDDENEIFGGTGIFRID
jgi:predicted transcriptional regulator